MVLGFGRTNIGVAWGSFIVWVATSQQAFDKLKLTAVVGFVSVTLGSFIA